MSLRVGGLFAGVGGIELGLAQVLDCHPAWWSEVDTAPSRVLAHRWPDVPNLGDITRIDWTLAEPVDVITGGSPCQDLSHAGKRLGMKPGTRSGLWAAMCDAIDILRPGLVVWENVRGALSAEAVGAVEPCPICVGDEREPHLRALGRVLGDLAELGYDAAWTGLRAADVGAPHGRFRVFVLAWPAADTDEPRREGAQPAPRRLLPDRGAPADADRVGGERDQRGSSGDLMLPSAVMTLLSTPVTAYSSTSADEWRARRPAGNGGEREQIGDLRIVVEETDFGPYAPAVARWEAVLGRPAPAPTEPTGKGGAHRLSARFVEFLMGLPDGWVTDAPGVTSRQALKALGNGCVPQQVAAAVTHLLEVRRTHALVA